MLGEAEAAIFIFEAAYVIQVRIAKMNESRGLVSTPVASAQN